MLPDTDCIFFRFSVVASPCSKGCVTVLSISSGVAPGYVVITTTYGKSMLGSRSGVIPRTDTIPSAIMITTTTNIVIGFFTLNFGIIFLFSLLIGVKFMNELICACNASFAFVLIYMKHLLCKLCPILVLNVTASYFENPLQFLYAFYFFKRFSVIRKLCQRKSPILGTIEVIITPPLFLQRLLNPRIAPALICAFVLHRRFNVLVMVKISDFGNHRGYYNIKFFSILFYSVVFEL